MNQLVCQIEEQPELAYLEISPQEEEKIQALIDQNRLPTVFTLNGVRIVSETILGFYDKRNSDSNPFKQKETPPPTNQKINSDFFERVRQQDWYQNGLRARTARLARQTG